MPRKVLRVEFRIDNNSDRFRSKTDELVTYLIGNRSPGTLSDWLQKQGLAEGIRADSDPVVNGNSGVLAISATLTDKGTAHRDEVTAAIFSYLDLLRTQGIDKRYFDELAHVLALDFRYPSINRDMDYVEWLADTMIRVPVEHALDVVNIADQYDPQAIKDRLAMMTLERPYLVYQPRGRITRRPTLSMRRIRWIRLASRRSLTGSTNRRPSSCGCRRSTPIFRMTSPLSKAIKHGRIRS